MPKVPTLIVADDSSLSRSVVLQALGSLPIEVVEADSGNAAIRAMNAHKPDLILLDICMPYPDGLTLLRMIRQDDEFADLPVIICSVENGLLERAEAEVYGISGYLTKPLDLRLLREMVILTLGLKKEAEGPEVASAS